LSIYAFGEAGIAGGAEVCDINGQQVLLLNFQNVSLSGYILEPVTDVKQDALRDYNFVLNQNYPNPFNPSTKISYSLREGGLVTLKVYDILGKEVASLLNENKPAGNYEIEFNASKLTSGVYIYSIKAGKFKQSKKMLLMK